MCAPLASSARTNWLTGRSDSPAVQFFRYFFAGGLAFVVDFALLFVLTEFARLHYLVSGAISFGVGVTVNYGLSVLWVFNRRSLKNPVAEFAVFTLLGVAGLGANALLMFSLTELVGLYYLASKVVSTAVTFVGNFVAKKLVLFSARGLAEAGEPEVRPVPVLGDVGLAESA